MTDNPDEYNGHLPGTDFSYDRIKAVYGGDMDNYPDEGCTAANWRDRWLASDDQCAKTWLEKEVERLEAEVDRLDEIICNDLVIIKRLEDSLKCQT